MKTLKEMYKNLCPKEINGVEEIEKEMILRRSTKARCEAFRRDGKYYCATFSNFCYQERYNSGFWAGEEVFLIDARSFNSFKEFKKAVKKVIRHYNKLVEKDISPELPKLTPRETRLFLQQICESL